MLWFFGRGRRRGGNGDSDASKSSIKRADNNNKRRECGRIYLPPADTLEIVSSTPEYIHQHFRVLDIVSEKAVGLVRIGEFLQEDVSLRMGHEINAAVMFHDGTCFEFEGKIIRYSSDLTSKNEKLVCLLNTRIPKKIIEREIEYLRDNYGSLLGELTRRADRYLDLEAAV